MNRLYLLARILIFCTGCSLLSLVSIGCPTVGPQYPVQYGPTATATATP